MAVAGLGVGAVFFFGHSTEAVEMGGLRRWREPPRSGGGGGVTRGLLLPGWVRTEPRGTGTGLRGPHAVVLVDVRGQDLWLTIL